IESMACGLPVITTVVGGLPNLVINNYNGFLIDLDFDKLEDYIKILAENEELRKTFGMRGIEIVKENFTLERWKNDWKQIINKFI
ncbi:MAG: glycosyltransferase, partial [candidate division WOR-3 bacterium]|nr:glycosyltransferase [candidate division WOR-3 bacterium]